MTTDGDAHLNSLGMSGDYNKHSAPQRMALEHTLPLLEQAALMVCSNTSFNVSDSFTVADYGSSHGGNSLRPMSVIIESVRKNTSANQTIGIYHTDLPHNDYNTLFRTLHESQKSYLKYASEDAPILTFATATPFFQQILPTGSVHLGFSSSATHWISCFPCEVQQLYTVAAPEPERALWRKQAAVDWEKFLQARTIELAPGGVLVLANLFMDDNGDYTTRELGFVMDNVISEMLENNMIDSKAARRFSHPSYFRTLKEHIDPLPCHNLTLRTAFSRHIQNPIYNEYKELDDWEGFGKAMVNWAKQWAHVALLRVIGNLEDGAKNAAADYFYRRVAEEVSARPHDHQILMVMLYLVIQKNQQPAACATP